MRIAMTYDLKQEYLEQGYDKEETAEFDSAETIEGLAQALCNMGHEPELIGSVSSLVRRLALGQRWDMAFNIAEGLHGMGRESLVPALFESWRIPCVFSDPSVLGLCLHKGMAKHVVRDLGLPTPDFAVVESLEDLRGLPLRYPLFAKPVAEGTGKGVGAASRCATPRELRKTCKALLLKHNQPVLVEEYLPGREFTVGIVGNGSKARVLGVIEIELLKDVECGAYGYETKDQYEDLAQYHLVNDPMAREAANTALKAYKGLGIRDAGRLDMRADANGRVHFIEANPLAGMNPIHSDLPIICRLAGISYQQLMNMIMDAAIARTMPEAAPAVPEVAREAALCAS